MPSYAGNRALAEKVRGKLLKKSLEILDGEDEKKKEALLFKMCVTLLPRLSELTGEGGGPIGFKNLTDLVLSVNKNEKKEWEAKQNNTIAGEAGVLEK